MADLTPNDLSHLSDAEFHALCPQGEHAPGPEPLSPTAQAVLDAANGASSYGPDDCLNDARWIAAAALRALADAVVPEETGPTGMRKSVEQFTYQEYRRAMRQETRASILALVTELENIND